MKINYKFAALAVAAAGIAVAATQFTGAPAVAAAAAAPMQVAECAAKDAQGRQLFQIGNGETVLFVPQGSALMRDRAGPRSYHHPELVNRIASVELQTRCRAVLYGQFGANWGHRVVRQTGATDVPANHVGGLKCECTG